MLFQLKLVNFISGLWRYLLLDFNKLMMISWWGFEWAYCQLIAPFRYMVTLARSEAPVTIPRIHTQKLQQ